MREMEAKTRKREKSCVWSENACIAKRKIVSSSGSSLDLPSRSDGYFEMNEGINNNGNE